VRPLEVLLLVADLVAFLLLVVPLPGGAGWMVRAAPLALPAMGAQLLVEGPRWQLVPAYALPGSAVRRHTGVVAAPMLQVSGAGWSDQALRAPKCSNTTGSE
jgi:hypothetical protein